MSSKRVERKGNSPYEPIVGYSRAVRVGRTSRGGHHRHRRGREDRGQGRSLRPGHPVLPEHRDRRSTRPGASFRDVVRTRMYVTDISRWEAVGRAHGQIFRDIRPAATMVEVRRARGPGHAGRDRGRRGGRRGRPRRRLPKRRTDPLRETPWAASGRASRSGRPRARPAFVAFLTAGDPSLDRTVEAALDLEARGGRRARARGALLRPARRRAGDPALERARPRARASPCAAVLATVRRIRERSELPLLLFSYFNPLLQHGLDAPRRARRRRPGSTACW